MKDVDNADDEKDDDVADADSVFCMLIEINRASEIDVHLDGRPLGHTDLSLA